MEYIRKVHYHETDRMGVTHHSNYLKYAEEARIEFLRQIGHGYAKLEASGITSPVLELECRYCRSTTFDDVLSIDINAESFNGIKLVFSYRITNSSNGEVVFTGKSAHCFLLDGKRPMNVKKELPEMYTALSEQIKCRSE